MNNRLLTKDDIHGAWAIIPTPALDNAADPGAENTVDLDATADLVSRLVEAGVDGILTLGTAGECASLSWEEKKAFLGAAVESARGKIPVFAGTTTLNTRDTIRQTRLAQDIGANGSMIGPPMWCQLDLPNAIDFYKHVAQACPEMAICVYANPYSFKFDFPRPFWAAMGQIPQVVSAKVASSGTLVTDIALSQGNIRFMPIEADYYSAARLDPENCTAFWSTGAGCGPAPILKLRELVREAKQSGDWSTAHQLTFRIAATYKPFFPRGSMQEFAIHNVGLEKNRIAAAEWGRIGPCRPPYHIMPQEFRAGAEESGRLWRALHDEMNK